MAPWPEADFIVGNPPFIAGQDLREELGSAYAEAVWRANPHVAGGADFVMQWWDRAATILTTPDTALRRFGLVTTNSITQDFSRRVIARHLAPPGAGEERKLSLVLAIPDHPWLKPAPLPPGGRRAKGEKGPAAVRIAMTVAQKGQHEGRHGTVADEHDVASYEPKVELDWTVGMIHADLSTGTKVIDARPLRANTGICHDGVKLHGKGFVVQRSLAVMLGRDRRPGLDLFVRPYRNGMDLSQRNPDAVRDKYVIDLFGLAERTVRTDFPDVYQHLLQTVKPERDANRRATYRDNWWIFGEPRREMRPALSALARFIATVDTAKHRLFQFIDADVVVDDKLVVVASDDSYVLGILSSIIHLKWTLRVGGLLEDRPVYVKSKTFDPFPFPDPTPVQRAAIAALGEELDATRKAALAEHPRLTMTGLYNLVEKLRRGGALTPAEADDARDARARIVQKLHDDLDTAVAAAYG